MPEADKAGERYPTDKPQAAPRGRCMRRRELLYLVACTAVLPFAGPSAAQAQQATKIRRIGYMGNSNATLEANLVGPFREGLRALGYEEGRNIQIEYRWAEGNYSRFPRLVAELLAAKVDVIVTAGTPAALAVKHATTSVPLVMVAVGDPVGTGIVPSLARPGGNITGLSSIAPDLEGKRLELLREIVPKLAHVAGIGDPFPFQISLAKAAPFFQKALLSIKANGFLPVYPRQRFLERSNFSATKGTANTNAETA